jgi:adenylosuccinate lyase
VLKKTVTVLARLADFAQRHRDLPCLAMTHLQPAQPTTVGKRASLWAYDLVLDIAELEHRLGSLAARSVRGTTGTMASFLAMFDGDHSKVLELQRRVAAKVGFDSTYAVTGQTYPRKVDTQILDALSGIAQSAHKMASDVRILAHRRELEEPFESEQVGSSAMAYKRNPMRCERICGLARFVMSLPANAAATAASQWMERTLDDSANRRLVLPQAFLATDAVLGLYENVARGFVVYPAVIERNLKTELPFMASENILMAAVAAGGDRQALHERIRQHSQAAAAEIKAGRDNDLWPRLRNDPAFTDIDWDKAIDAKTFIGCAPQQVDAFCQEQVEPILSRYPAAASWRYEPDV